MSEILSYEAENVWLSQRRMAELFDRERFVLTRHLHIVGSGETT